MHITKRDVLELRRRFTKKNCTLGPMSGCYVSGSKSVLLKFSEFLPDLEDDEFYKYLDIVKKTLSGSLGNNLLELEFARDESGVERQQYLLTLRDSKLKNEELLNRLYEQIITHYEYDGNYLILVFHDVYDVMTRTSDRAKLDESEETYAYLLCAVCPVELSRAGLGYQEEEHRIGARDRDWVVGLPDLGFLYPAFSQRSSDVNAVLYYVKNAKDAHAEFMEQVLGCIPQRTAAEDKTLFTAIVKNAFGEQDETAERAYCSIQKNLQEIAAEQEETESAIPITPQTVAGVISDVDMPDEIKQRITQNYAQEFSAAPPPVQNLVDPKSAASGAERARVAHLEQQVLTLRQQLGCPPAADDTPPWEESSGIVVQMPEDNTGTISVQQINGRPCLVIPLDGESANVNGTPICT